MVSDGRAAAKPSGDAGLCLLHTRPAPQGKPTSWNSLEHSQPGSFFLCQPPLVRFGEILCQGGLRCESPHTSNLVINRRFRQHPVFIPAEAHTLHPRNAGYGLAPGNPRVRRFPAPTEHRPERAVGLSAPLLPTRSRVPASALLMVRPTESHSACHSSESSTWG